MNEFPRFMTNPQNAIASHQQSAGVEGYVFDGLDGSQMAVFQCRKDGVSREHVHDFDEYFVVVRGEYTLGMEGRRLVLKAGDEFYIPRGVPHDGAFLAGTRTIHAFGGRRADRNAGQGMLEDEVGMPLTGFIGFGSMGGMLVRGFLSSGALAHRDVLVSTRTVERTAALRAAWPDVQVTGRNRTVAERCQRIFLCVTPAEIRPLLDEIRHDLRDGAHLISIAAGVTVAQIESVCAGRITRAIPSLTSEVREGITLLCHGKSVSQSDRDAVSGLFSAIGTVKTIREEDFEVAADLTSCAPGLFAALFQEFVESGLRHGGLERAEAVEMVVKTAFGFAKLLSEQGLTFEETIARVATKGGITEEGVRVLRAGLPGLFDDLFKATLGKHESRKASLRRQFAGR